MAPIEFIGRYMPEWFDYAICDEIHQLAGDTAQGNALGTLASCTNRIVGLTGTLLGGYADGTPVQTSNSWGASPLIPIVRSGI
jgi:superfamily II DNA or RNA helicase